jgi:hypothetical protein
MIKIVQADFVQDKVIRISFSDGTGGDYDLAPLIACGTEMVNPLEDETYFRRFFLALGALCMSRNSAVRCELTAHRGACLMLDF